MKLEVGMYVRFKDKRGNHYIRKITSVNTKYPDKRFAGVYIDEEANNVTGVSLKNIIKASHNIIDLIEEYDIIKHDILKTLEVKEIDKENGTICFYNVSWKFNIEDFQKGFELGTIKILTHEQFENNCYKIGD